MRCAPVLLFALAAAPAWSADNDTALELLRNMNRAAVTLSYQGTFIYAHAGKVESIQIFHRSNTKGERERVVHLNGTPREVIRADNVITCILPDSKSVTVSRHESAQRLLASLPSNLGEYSQYYRFSLAGQDRVAGRPAIIVQAEPNDAFRYGHRYWIDAQNSLLLKSEMINDRGAVVEQIMFTALEVVSDIPDDLLKPGMTGKHVTRVANPAESKPRASGLTVRFERMPSGFKSTGNQREHTDDGNPVHHVVLSDGLASVSVYVEKRDPASKQFIGGSYTGAVNVYGTVVREYQVTAVGEVPAATVKMVAESVQLGE